MSRWVHASVHNYIYDGCDDRKKSRKTGAKGGSSRSFQVLRNHTSRDLRTQRLSNSPTTRNQPKVTGYTARGVHGCIAFAPSRLATSIGKRIWHPAMCCVLHLCQWRGSVFFSENPWEVCRLVCIKKKGKIQQAKRTKDQLLDKQPNHNNQNKIQTTWLRFDDLTSTILRHLLFWQSGRIQGREDWLRYGPTDARVKLWQTRVTPNNREPVTVARTNARFPAQAHSCCPAQKDAKLIVPGWFLQLLRVHVRYGSVCCFSREACAVSVPH